MGTGVPSPLQALCGVGRTTQGAAGQSCSGGLKGTGKKTTAGSSYSAPTQLCPLHCPELRPAVSTPGPGAHLTSQCCPLGCDGQMWAGRQDRHPRGRTGLLEGTGSCAHREDEEVGGDQPRGARFRTNMQNVWMPLNLELKNRFFLLCMSICVVSGADSDQRERGRPPFCPSLTGRPALQPRALPP